MNKVLRDSETQLKGTALFVICAFQLNNFEPLGHQIQYCLHLYPDGKHTHKKNFSVLDHDIMYRRKMLLIHFHIVMDLSQLFWLAPNTIRVHCSM